MLSTHWMTAAEARLLAEDLIARAELLREQQRFAEAVPDYGMALAYFTGLSSTEKIVHGWLMARAWVGRAQCLQGKAPHRALDDFSLAIDFLRSVPPAVAFPDRILLPVALRARAGLLADEGRFEEGLQDASESLAIWREFSEEGHAVGEDLADALLKRGGIFMADERYEESWGDCNEAVGLLGSLRKDAYDVELNLEATALLCRAMAAERRGLEMDALRDLDASVLRLEAAWPDGPELSLALFAGVLFERARLARRLGDGKQALDDCERSLHVAELANRRQGHADYALWAEMHIERSELLAATGAYGRALDDIEQALHYFDWLRKYGAGPDEERVQEAHEKRVEYIAGMRKERTFDA